jgi:transposase-like protein
VQLCVVHLVRSSLRYTSKKHWGQVCREMREIYTAPTVDAAEAASPSSPNVGGPSTRR